MEIIEKLREKLYFAIDNGNLQEVLEASQKLDSEIVNFMQGEQNNKIVYPKIIYLQKYQENIKGRSCEHDRNSYTRTIRTGRRYPKR